MVILSGMKVGRRSGSSMTVVTAVVKMNINIHLMRQMSSSMKVGRMSGSDDESGDSDGEDEHLHAPDNGTFDLYQ